MDKNMEVSVQETGATETVPAEQSTTESVITETTNADSATANEAEVQSAEENSRYAAARRKAEAETKALRDEIDRLNKQFVALAGNNVNPLTQKAITSAQEYIDAVSAQKQAQLQQSLVAKGVDPDILKEYVAEALQSDPTMKQAQSIIALEQQRAEELKEQQIKATIDEDVKSISRLFDSSIKSLDDLMKDEHFPDMVKHCADHNCSLLDAYKSVNFDKIMSAQQAKIQQQTINQVNGKSHLGATNGTADKGVDVPPDLYDRLKRLYPDKSDAQLREMCSRTAKTFRS